MYLIPEDHQFGHLYLRVPSNKSGRSSLKSDRKVLQFVVQIIDTMFGNGQQLVIQQKNDDTNTDTNSGKHDAVPAPPLITSLFTSPIITLEVGGPESPSCEPQPTYFHVHREMLLQHSPIFRVMLGGAEQSNSNASGVAPVTWTEATKDVLQLPEDRACDWAMLLRWLYSGHHSQASEILAVHQLGLEHEAIDEAVRQCVAWRERNGYIDFFPQTTTTENQDPASGLYVPSLRFRGSRRATDKILGGSQSPLTREPKKKKRAPVYPPPIRPSDQELRATPTTLPAPTEEPRPELPALGPFIRLYILADKYLISEQSLSFSGTDNESENVVVPSLYDPSHIKYQIYLRLQTINNLIKVVPDCEDVDRLWSNITTDACKDPLKTGILGMYGALTERERQKIVWADKRRWNYDFMKDLFVMAPSQTNVPVAGSSW